MVRQLIEIKSYEGRLSDEINEELSNIHNLIFNAKVDLDEKLIGKESVLTLIAYQDYAIIGYKISYEKDEGTFYSWLGGVKNEYRKQGIAQKLMDKQIAIVKSKGYQKVQTKTYNKWKSMLILNIKNDFQIVDCFKDSNNLEAIILEKYIS